MRAITKVIAPLCSLLMLACGNKATEPKKSPLAEVKPTPATIAASTPAPMSAPVVSPPVAIKPLDPKAALHQLYGGDAAQETATWMTDKAEVSKYPLHYPKLVDTMPDKLEFKVELTKTFQRADKERTLVVFRAEDEGDNIYYGGAVFEWTGSEWRLVFSQKLFDNVAQMSGDLDAAWLPIGMDKYAVVTQDYSGGTEGGATVNYYHEMTGNAFRFTLSLAISEEAYEKNEEGIKEDAGSTERKVKMVPNPTNAAYLDIQTTEELPEGKSKVTLYRHNGTEYAEVK